MHAEHYERLLGWLRTHRTVVLLVTAAVGIVGVGASSYLELEEDILAVLPNGDPVVDEYRYALETFAASERVYFDISAGGDVALADAAADALRERLIGHASISTVTGAMAISGGLGLRDLVPLLVPNLFEESDAAALEERLDPAAIRGYLTDMRRRATGIEGLVLVQFLAVDPIGMSGLLLHKLASLSTGFDGARIDGGRILSPDGQHQLIIAQPTIPASDTRAGEDLVADLLRASTEIEARFAGVRVAMAGGHRISVDNATLIKQDAMRCLFIGTAAMMLLCFAAFRRRWLAALTFLPTFFGGAVAVAALAIWEPTLSGIAVGFGVIAIGVTVDYAIHVVYELDNAAAADHSAIGSHVARLVRPVAAGALTSVAAFGVLATSPMNGYRQLGVFGAIGVVFSATFALLVLPLLVPRSQGGERPQPLVLTRALDRFHAWRSRRAPILVAGVVLLSVLAALGLPRMAFEGDLARLNGITEATREDEQRIREIWGDALGLSMVISRGSTLDEALERNDRATTLLAGFPGVGSLSSVSPLLPSAATQRDNLARWRAFWTPGRRDRLRSTLAEIGGELGFRAGAFTAFWSDLDRTNPPITLDTYGGTPLEVVLDERIQSDGAHAVATLVRLDSSSRVDELRAVLAGPLVVDQRTFANHVAGLAEDGVWRFAIGTTLLVGVILYLFLGSVELMGVTLVPIAVGLLWTFGLMGWVGIPIDIMNGVFVIFLIGISEDYSVFMVTSKLDRWRGRRNSLSSASAGVSISALTTLFAFAVLVLARHPVLFSVGVTVLIGMICTFSATILLAPLCMDLLLFRDPPRGAPRWWHLLGTLWAAIHLGVSQLLVLGILLPLLRLVTPRTALPLTRRVSRKAIELVVRAFPFGRLRVEGLSSDTFSKPVIAVSNHQSAVDVLIIFSLSDKLRLTSKKRVWNTPTLGMAGKLLGHVMIQPEKPKVTLTRCKEKLAEGASVHFFPEGTRSPDGFPIPFRRGAFSLAVTLRADIQPIVLCDTWTCMPRDAYWFEPYSASLRVLPPITPNTFDYDRGSTALMRHCEAIVRESFQTQLDELNTAQTLRRKVLRLYRYQGKAVEQFAYWKLRCDPLFDSLDELVPRSGFVLDLGCGFGLTTNWLAQTTDQRRLHGMDYDPRKIRVAKRTAPGDGRITFEHGDLLDRELPPCDVVLLLDVLHYWSSEKQQRILDRARAALRPGGCLVLRDDIAAKDGGYGSRHWAERIATRVGHNRTVEGLNFRTENELEVAVRRAGFADVELNPVAGTAHSIWLRAWAPGCGSPSG